MSYSIAAPNASANRSSLIANGSAVKNTKKNVSVTNHMQNYFGFSRTRTDRKKLRNILSNTKPRITAKRAEPDHLVTNQPLGEEFSLL